MMTSQPPAPPPVSGNLAPSKAALDEGQSMLSRLSQLSGRDSLFPNDVRAVFGVTASPSNGSAGIVYADKYQRIWYNLTKLPENVVSGNYFIAWNFNGNNGENLSLNINEYRSCITEQMLMARLGSGELSHSTMRHFAPGAVVPQGLQPTRDDWTYRKGDGVTLTFGFDYVCAAEVDMRRPRSLDWAPTAGETQPPDAQ